MRSFAAVFRVVAAVFLGACSAPTAGDETDAAGADRGSPAAAESFQTERPTSAPIVVPIEDAFADTPLTFEVPKHALGFTVIVESDAPVSFLGIERLVNPDGVVVISQYVSGGVGARSTVAYGPVASAVVPQTDGPESVPIPGRWTVVLSALGATGMPVTAPLRASVRVQTTDDSAFRGGMLDLNVFVPDGLVVQDPLASHAISAAEAESDACVKARIDGFYEGLSKMVGIDRGKVTFHRLPGRFLEIRSDEAFAEALRETAAVPDGPGLNFVLTNHIETAVGFEAWGTAGALGGPATRNGTDRSGVMLAIKPMFPAYGDALTMLHEAGHYFGLGHTSEMIPGTFDVLADTPQCTSLSYEQFAHCPDKQDLMFPLYFGASNGGQGVYLTPGQVRVMRGSPLYRAYRK